MAIYHVDSAVASSGNGSTWALAYQTLAEGLTAASNAGDEIWISHEHSITSSLSQAYVVGSAHTPGNPLKIISVNKSTGLIQKGATINSSGMGLSIGGTGIGVYVFGVAFNAVGTTAVSTGVAYGEDSLSIFEDCDFLRTSTSTSTSANFVIGSSATEGQSVAIFNRCLIGFSHANSSVSIRRGVHIFNDCAMSVGSAHPSFYIKGLSTNAKIEFNGCDFSGVTNFLGSTLGYGFVDAKLTNCKLEPGMTIGTTEIGSRVELIDCASGDAHGGYWLAVNQGSLQTDTGIYCDDNVSENASWKITTTAAASRYNPFVSPWISVYHDGTSAITPFLEILRSGSSTAFTDAEVWAEWSYKGTSGSTRATIDDDGAALLATPANQTASSKGASDWTGENATSWFGKIGPGSSITPAEAGDLSFRICVGAASTTVYIDPQIRGLS